MTRVVPSGLVFFLLLLALPDISPVAAQFDPVAEIVLPPGSSAFVTRTASENTGVAMYNPSATTSVTIDARLFDKNGVQVAGPRTVTLAARNQRALFVTDASLFSTYIAWVAGGFEGTMQLKVTAGGPIAVVSLLQKSNNALLAVRVESAAAPGL